MGLNRSISPKSKQFKYWIYFEILILRKYINLIQVIQWTSKLNTSHTSGKYHLGNILKCIEWDVKPPTLQNELLQVSFLCISNYCPSYFPAATSFLEEGFINHYYKKSETKIFKQKRFRKKLVQSQWKKNLISWDWIRCLNCLQLLKVSS